MTEASAASHVLPLQAPAVAAPAWLRSSLRSKTPRGSQPITSLALTAAALLWSRATGQAGPVCALCMDWGVGCDSLDAVRHRGCF